MGRVGRWGGAWAGPEASYSLSQAEEAGGRATHLTQGQRAQVQGSGLGAGVSIPI